MITAIAATGRAEPKARIVEVPPGSHKRCGPRRMDCVSTYETSFYRMAAGPVWADGELAADTRLEFGVLIGGAPDLPGIVVDATLGLRRLEAPSIWAVSAPTMNIRLGYSHFPLIATGGLGLQYVIVDELDEDVGVGILVPEAQGAVELDLGFARVGVLGVAGHRWQWGAADYPALGVSGTLSWVFVKPEGPACEAVRERLACGSP